VDNKKKKKLLLALLFTSLAIWVYRLDLFAPPKPMARDEKSFF